MYPRPQARELRLAMECWPCPSRRQTLRALAAALALGGTATCLAACDGPHAEGAQLTLLSDYGDARCQDGSPGAYYFQEATDQANRDAWVIFLQGGGSCIDNATCSDRRSGPHGSSAEYPAARSDLPQFVSRDPAKNPALAGWNHVFVMYCTGDLHLGQMLPSDAPHWGWARFSGHLVVERVLDDLVKRRRLGEARELVWTGASAGGIGSFAHLDHVARRFPGARVVGAPIAGYLWDNAKQYAGPGRRSAVIPFGADDFKAYGMLWNAFLPASCAEGPHKTDPWVCALAHFSFPTVTTPAFFMAAQIDKVELELHNRAHCDPRRAGWASEAEYCLQWGRNNTANLQQVVELARADPKQTGLFSPACLMHTEFDQHAPRVDGMSSVEAFAAWMALREGKTTGAPVVKEDDCCSGEGIAWNPTCHGAEDTLYM